ncbi:MAG: hypothetical protein KDF54_12590 [Hydrogenophaga sp.]|nr:hypothetical protein [Hydrogenophaga sp.]
MRQIWVGSILLSIALASSAASLGRHSGAAVIGRPLDIKVQALSGTEEELSGPCVKADIFFGDFQLGPASVRTSVQRSAPDAETSIRIQTTVPVNEPIVTINVRAGCTSPFSRRYVLLADPLSEPATVVSPSEPVGAVVSAPVAVGQPVAPQEPRVVLRADVDGSAISRRAAATGNKPASATVASSGSRARKPSSVVRKAPDPQKVVEGPRLQLDPVDVSLAIERDPVLRLSLSLLSEPTSNEQEREAAAQLWKALNASPEDVLRDAQKLSVLEAEAKGLREQEQRNKATLEAMQNELERSKYMTWVAYGLGALLLASLGALFWFYKRKSAPGGASAQGKDWWAAAAQKTSPTMGAAPAKAKSKSAVDLDLDLGDMSDMSDLHDLRDSHREAGESEASLLSLSLSEGRDFQGSQLGVSRSVATEELFDVQQQSEFFVSLGEFEQAIGILKNHISESQEPSPLAYLDLFGLYHQLNRRDEYEQLRSEFNHKFNAGAPVFEYYSSDSRGLESYDVAFGRIQALWPEPRVLDVIENSVFRDTSDPDSEVFTLEAYRELLLLHAIAKDVIKRDNGTSSDFQHTSIRPLKAAGGGAAAGGATADRVTEPMDNIPHASPRLGLDVDLDALQEASAFEASLPDVDVPVEQTAKAAPPPGSASAEQMSAGNLIDFEVLDFMQPDETSGKSS